MMSKKPLVRDDLNILKGYHSPQLDVPVKLNTNESPFSLPDGFLEELSSALEKLDLNRYPKRDANELCLSIAERESLNENQVFAANGSNEIIQSIFLAFGGHNRSVLIFEPTYAMHSQIAKITGTRVVSGLREIDFQVNADAALRLIDKEKPEIVFLCSPNNPTGNLESEALIKSILANLNDSGGLLVLDEAYKEFANQSLSLTVDEGSNLIFLRTFSKVWKLAGIRLGYLLAPEWCIDEIKNVSLPYHLDSIKQKAGVLALKHENEMLAQLENVKEEKNRVYENLLDFSVNVWPSEANFLLFKPNEIDGYKLWSDLFEKGVLVRDCSSWEGLEGCLRVTIGNPEENTRFLEALQEILNNG